MIEIPDGDYFYGNGGVFIRIAPGEKRTANIIWYDSGVLMCGSDIQIAWWDKDRIVIKKKYGEPLQPSSPRYCRITNEQFAEYVFEEALSQLGDHNARTAHD